MNAITRVVGLSAAVLTLAGAGAGTALAGGQHSDTAQRQVVAGSHVPALKPAQVKYGRILLCDCDTPNSESTFNLDAPRGWRRADLSPTELQLTGGSGAWRLRVHRLGATKTPAAMADAKVRALRGTSGLKVIFRTTGHANGYRYTTLAYRYRDAHGATRLVFTRWYAVSWTQGKALFETSVAGRPMDKDGLWAVQAKATNTLEFAG